MNLVLASTPTGANGGKRSRMRYKLRGAAVSRSEFPRLHNHNFVIQVIQLEIMYVLYQLAWGQIISESRAKPRMYL